MFPTCIDLEGIKLTGGSQGSSPTATSKKHGAHHKPKHHGSGTGFASGTGFPTAPSGHRPTGHHPKPTAPSGHRPSGHHPKPTATGSFMPHHTTLSSLTAPSSIA